MGEIMTTLEFRRGLFLLCENRMDKAIARILVGSYHFADNDAKLDCSNMLREDLWNTHHKEGESD